MHARGRLPQLAAIEGARRELASVDTQLVNARTSAGDVQRELVKSDQDVQLVRDRAARNQSRLDAGQGSAKDLQALQHELASLARRQSELEDLELAVMERSEALEAKVATLDTQRTELSSRVATLEAERDAALADLAAEEEKVGSGRADLVASVGDDLVALYEKVRTSSGGLAAAELKHRRCGGCRLELNNVDLDRIRAAAPGRGRALRGVPSHHDPHRRVRSVSRGAHRTVPDGLGRRRLVIEADGGSRGNPGVGRLRRPRPRPGHRCGARRAGRAARQAEQQRRRVLRAHRRAARGRSTSTHRPRSSRGWTPSSSWSRCPVGGRSSTRTCAASPLEARDLCAEIGDAGGSVSFEWIPREKNKDADKLSNDAMDGLTVHRVLHDEGTRSPAAQSDSPPEPTGGHTDDDASATTPSASPGRPLRLLLVQAPLVDGAVPRVVAAVRRLVGAESEVVTSEEPLALEVARAVAAAVDAEPAVSTVWAGTAPGEHVDETVRTAYRSLVATGGTVVVVTTRRGVLSVLADVLETPGPRFWALATAPGSLTAVEVWEDGSATVAFTNRTDHLA